MKKLPIGIQAYSIREELAKDMEKGMTALKDIGYDFVELAGTYGYEPAAIKALLKKIDLPALSAHVPLSDMMGDAEGVMAAYEEIGCKYIVIPYLPDEYRPLTPGFAEVLACIPELGKTAAKHGMTLLYHNHDFEFVKMPDGAYALDHLYGTIPDTLLKTELDCCWIEVAGESAPAYLRKYAGRCPVVHLKDYYLEGNPSDLYELIGVKPSASGKAPQGRFEFRPLGFGMQVMPELVAAAEEAGAEYLVVEQDLSVGRSPLEAVKLSREYLKLLGY